jgi:hypothetical protein
MVEDMMEPQSPGFFRFGAKSFRMEVPIMAVNSVNLPLKYFFAQTHGTQRWAARDIGINEVQLSMIVHGKRPTATERPKLLKALGKDKFRELLGEEVE